MNWLRNLDNAAYRVDEGNVILGYIGSGVELGEDYIEANRESSIIGGDVWWIDGVGPPDEMLLCDCGGHMDFVLQVFAPIIGYEHASHRVLYFFQCNQCPIDERWSKWRVVRGQIVGEVEVEESSVDTEPKPAASTTTTDSWDTGVGVAADDWGSNSFGDGDEDVGWDVDEVEVENLLAEREEVNEEKQEARSKAKAKAKGKKGKSKSKSKRKVDAVGRYIETAIEPAKQKAKEAPHDHDHSHEEEDFGEGEGGGGGDNSIAVGWVNEDYESGTADQRFLLRFQERMHRSPEQILRYSYGGTALWLSSEEPSTAASFSSSSSPSPLPLKLKSPECTLCGAVCIFEMQILSTLKYWKGGEGEGESTLTATEWGVVAVYTCSDSCIPQDKAVYSIEECVYIQKE